MAAASATSGSRSPTAATSAASTACRPRACPGSNAREILSFEEIERLVGLLVALGIRDVRLTGGEPLVRRELPKLVAMLAGDRGPRGPLADHQRLPAGARRRGARRGRASTASTSRSTRCSATASSRSPAAMPCPRCCAGWRRSPPSPQVRPIKVNAVAIRGFSERGSAALRRARPLERLPGALHRVHAARRRPRLEPRAGAERRGAARADRRRLPARGASRASRRRPRGSSASATAAARSASSTRSPNRSAPTATAFA